MKKRQSISITNGCGKWGNLMAKIEFKGIDEYAEKLGILWKESEGMIERAVYAGADVVADEIKKGLQALPVEEGFGTPEHPLNGVGRGQKADLIDGFGLAPMQNDDGYINTKAGFDGYGSIQTKAYPNGQPNALLMRSVESGTSFRKKHPVIRNAVNRAKERSQEAMQKTIEKEIDSWFEK